MRIQKNSKEFQEYCKKWRRDTTTPWFCCPHSERCRNPLSIRWRAGSLAEDESNCRFISQLEGAIPQLVLMVLTDNEIVVEQACKVIGARSWIPNIEGDTTDSIHTP